MKKKNCIIAIIMVAILTLSITASAYFADVYAEHWFTDLWIYGSSTIEPNTDSGLSELYAQVSIQDGDLNEYGFNNRTVKNPTISSMKVTASARKSSIPPEVAELIIVAYGHIKYMTKYGEQKDYWTDDDAFFTSEYYTSGVAEKDNSYNREIGVLYNETRANYIFESFGMNPTQYVYACDFDLLEYTEVDEYLSIREYMNIQNGTTTPSFFIKDNTIFGVCQDVTAMNYIYEFMKDSLLSINRNAQSGDVVLLSPGSASWDQSDSARFAGLRRSRRGDGRRRGTCGVEGTQDFRIGGSPRCHLGAGRHSETGSNIRSETNHSRF